MTTSNRLEITEFATGSDPVPIGNEAIALLEAGAGRWNCKQVNLNTPPGSPSEGDLYIVGTSATGAWAGQERNKALYYNSDWLFAPPIEGDAAYDQNTDTDYKYDGTDWSVRLIESFVVACSDETTVLEAGTGKITFRMPYALTVTAVRASLTTAQTSGDIVTVDINKNGSTILSTKLTIDNGEKTSTTAATAAVISDSALGDDDEMSIDIDQVDNQTDASAAGLKVTIIGHQ